MELSRNAPSLFDVLVKKAVEGDSKAFREIYDAISGKMYSMCLRYAGNENDANDFFQEGFIKLYRNLKSFRGEGSFEGWARKLFVRVCIDHIKKNKTFFTVISDDLSVTTEGLSGYDKLSGEDLMKVIRRMPDGYRTVINLYLVEGYNHKEIGEMLNISEEGSRSQLHRARTSLQKLLTEIHA
ncbi:MAG: sigma-70 family RNA polymerase sigma factor [Bacteroidota bacterium]